MITDAYVWKDEEPMLSLENDGRTLGDYLTDLKECYEGDNKEELSKTLRNFYTIHLNSGLIKLKDNIVDAKRKILEEKYS